MKESIGSLMERLMMDEMIQDASNMHPFIQGLSGYGVFDWFESSGRAKNLYTVAKDFTDTGICNSPYHSPFQDNSTYAIRTAGAVCEEIGVTILKQEFPNLVILTQENILALMKSFYPIFRRHHECIGTDSLFDISIPDAIATDYDQRGRPKIRFFGEITGRSVENFLTDNLSAKASGIKYLRVNFPRYFRPDAFDIYLKTPTNGVDVPDLYERSGVVISNSQLPFSQAQLSRFMHYFINSYRPESGLPALAQLSDAWRVI